jgi:Holliday junction resolvase
MGLKNGKRKGTRNEHKTMRLLEQMGYVCLRSSASLGLFDVIGINKTETLCVSVKSTEWPSSVEMEQLQLFKKQKTHPRCRVLVHRWKDRRLLPDIREV